MKGKSILLLIGLAAVAAPLGLRMARIAALPGFTPGIVHHYRHRVEIEDAAFAVKTASGNLTIHAGTMQAGHERVGFFKLGPASFVSLREVSAELVDGRGARWSIASKAARLKKDYVEFQQKVTLIGPDGAEKTRDRFRFDFCKDPFSSE